MVIKVCAWHRPQFVWYLPWTWSAVTGIAWWGWHQWGVTHGICARCASDTFTHINTNMEVQP